MKPSLLRPYRDRSERMRLVADHIERGETLMDGAYRLHVSYQTLRGWIRELEPEVEVRVVGFAGERWPS